MDKSEKLSGEGEAGAWSNQVNRRLIHWAYIQFAIDQLLAGSLIV